MKEYSTIRITSITKAAIVLCKLKDETFEDILLRLIREAGHELPKDMPVRVPREANKYAALDDCKLGESLKVLWWGKEDPLTGLYPENQSRIYNAVTRVERKYGRQFRRRGVPDGLIVTRIR